MREAKFVVKTLNKPARPCNDIQISGWPLSVWPALPIGLVEGEGNGAGIWGENPSNLLPWSTFWWYFPTLSPLWLPGGNGFILLGGMARPGEESEIHCCSIRHVLSKPAPLMQFVVQALLPRAEFLPFHNLSRAEILIFPNWSWLREVMLWWSSTSSVQWGSRALYTLQELILGAWTHLWDW